MKLYEASITILRDKDGRYRWMKAPALQLPDSAPNAGRIIGSMVDIDAQISAQQSLREAARHKEEFLAMLGHELRNTLVPIRSAAEIRHHLRRR